MVLEILIAYSYPAIFEYVSWGLWSTWNTSKSKLKLKDRKSVV